ncbi:MAG: CaiB/BaiF CoA transferase family protein [Candidatus Bathyarchaeia archaeon]
MKKILEDIRVLDLTHVWHGPWCTMMLAELGAEVIKLEPPWGSMGRLSQDPEGMYAGATSTFHHLNLNKKDIAVNLKEPKGKKIFEELVKICDVVVENFSPGTMDRLGLGYEDLRKIKPDIIYAALSGFGQTGPYTSWPAYAVIAEAMAGFTRSQGDRVDPDGPPISMTGAFGDLAPGTMAAMCIIAAIRYRDKTGKGQMVDEAQSDCMVAYQTGITGYFLSGKTEIERRKEAEERARQRPERRDRGIGGIIKVKDGYIQVAGWRARGIDMLREKLGVKEVDPEALRKHLETISRDDAVKFFAEVGLPVAPIYYASEATKDPHLIARNMFIEVEHPKLGKYTAVNFPVKLSESPAEVVSAAPLLGQHNKEILMNYLGYTEEEIIQLEKEGVIGQDKSK